MDPERNQSRPGIVSPSGDRYLSRVRYFGSSRPVVQVGAGKTVTFSGLLDPNPTVPPVMTKFGPADGVIRIDSLAEGSLLRDGILGL